MFFERFENQFLKLIIALLLHLGIKDRFLDMRVDIEFGFDLLEETCVITVLVSFELLKQRGNGFMICLQNLYRVHWCFLPIQNRLYYSNVPDSGRSRPAGGWSRTKPASGNMATG